MSKVMVCMVYKKKICINKYQKKKLYLVNGPPPKRNLGHCTIKIIFNILLFTKYCPFSFTSVT